MVIEIGQKFKRLTIVEKSNKKDAGRNSYYLCLCDCGNKKLVRRNHLLSGRIVSCGCYRKELIDGYLRKKNTTHGKSYSKIYGIYASMMDRCYNSNMHAYHRYGGRGIFVCERWHKFENFYEDMGDPPRGMTLDRTDNAKGYSKENCRWATRKEQSNNTRTNKFIAFNGRIQTMQQWAEELEINGCTLRDRFKRGWDVGKAFTKKPRLKGLKEVSKI